MEDSNEPLMMLAGAAMVVFGVLAIVVRESFARSRYRFEVRNPHSVEPSRANVTLTVIGGITAIGVGTLGFVMGLLN